VASAFSVIPGRKFANRLFIRFDSAAPPRYVRIDLKAKAGLAATAPDDEQEVVKRIAQGDRPALAFLYDRYAAVLLAVGRRVLGDAREAEDLVHDVFLEIWRSAADYDATRGSVRSWILMRMRSRALDRKKSPRMARNVALEGSGVEAAPAMTEDPHFAPDRSRIRRALAELPAEQRVVLELGYYEGLSSTEIATRQAIPIGTVKSRVAAGLAKLRAGLASPERFRDRS
jgi:RNA polymerase sigma-70 factor, ECF subfamily